MVNRLEIPFIPSRGLECGQACAAMMIKYFYPDFEPNFDEINRIIGHQPGKYTFPLQNALLLDHDGVYGKCYSRDDYKTTVEEPGIFRRWFGKEYKELIDQVDIPGYNRMVVEGRKRNLFEKRRTTFPQIVQYFRRGYIVALVIDWKTLINKTGGFEGHFVILSGIENGNYLIHDPDDGSYIRYNKARLEAAYHHPIITDDLFVAFGRKSQSI
jgi:hypothetical protein